MITCSTTLVVVLDSCSVLVLLVILQIPKLCYCYSFHLYDGECPLYSCLHADPTRCRIFHKCFASGEKKTFMCRVGNAFDSQQRRCLPSPQGCRFTTGERTSFEGERGARSEATFRMNVGKRRGMRRYEQRNNGSVSTETSSADLNLTEGSVSTHRGNNLPLRSGRERSRKPSTRIQQNDHTISVSNFPSQNRQKEVVIPRDQEAARARSIYFSRRIPDTRTLSDAHFTDQELSRVESRKPVVQGSERALSGHLSRDVSHNAQHMQREPFIKSRDELGIAPVPRTSRIHPKNAHSHNGLDSSAQNVPKEVFIKPRDQDTLTSQYYSEKMGSLPSVGLAIQSPSLSPLQSSLKIIEEQSDSERYRQLPMRRFVIDGILPQYQNRLNDGVPGVEMTVSDRSKQIYREPGSDTQVSGVLRTPNMQESDGKDTCNCFNDLFHLLKKMDDNRASNQTGVLDSIQESINRGSDPSREFEIDQKNNEKDSIAGNNNEDQSNISDGEQQINDNKFNQPGTLKSNQQNSNGGFKQFGIIVGNQQNSNADSNQSGISNGEKQNNDNEFKQPGMLSNQEYSNGGFNQFGIIVGNQKNSNKDSKQFGIPDGEQQNNDNEFKQPGTFSNQEYSNGGFNQFGIIVGNQTNYNEDSNQFGIPDGEQQNNDDGFNQFGILIGNQQDSDIDPKQPGELENSNGGFNQFGTFDGGQQNSFNQPGTFQNSNEGFGQFGIFNSGQQNNNNNNQPSISGTFETDQQKENNQTDFGQPKIFGNSQPNDGGSSQFGVFQREQQNNDQEPNQPVSLQGVEDNSSNSDSSQTMLKNEEKNIKIDSLYPNLESILGENLNKSTDIDVTSLFYSLQENGTIQSDLRSTTEDTGTGGAFFPDNVNLNPGTESGFAVSSNSQSNGLNNFPASGDDSNTQIIQNNQNNTIVKETGGYNYYRPVIKEYKEKVRVTTSYILGDQTMQNNPGIKFLNQFPVNQTNVPEYTGTEFTKTSNGSTTNIIDGNKANDETINIPDDYLKIGNAEDNPPNYNQYYPQNVDNSFNNQFINTRRQQMPNVDYTQNEQSVVPNTLPQEFSNVRGHFITEIPPGRPFGITHPYQHTEMLPEYSSLPPILQTFQHNLPLNFLPQKVFENSHISLPAYPPPSVFYSIDPRIRSSIHAGNSPLVTSSVSTDNVMNKHQTNVLAGPTEYESSIQDSVGTNGKSLEGYDNSNKAILTNYYSVNNAQQDEENTTDVALRNHSTFMQGDVSASKPQLPFTNENFNIQYLPPPDDANGDRFLNLQTSKIDSGVQSDGHFQSENDKKDYYFKTNTEFKAAVTPETFISPPLPFFTNPYGGLPLYTTISPYIVQTTLTPLELYNINQLQSTPKAVTGIVNQVEVVRSLSFSLDSDDGRRQFENARSQGIWR